MVQEGPSSTRPCQVQQLWDAVDADGNGSLDRAELGELLGLLGRPPSDTERLMAEIDTDGDGEVRAWA